MNLPTAVQRYLDKAGTQGPWRLSGTERTDFYGAVVIPSLAEGDSLFQTLQGLSANASAAISDFLVVVVVNHAEQAVDADRLQNAVDLQRLQAFSRDSALNLAWVDAASAGLEVPGRQAGVGFARKLGMDLALKFLAWDANPLLVCLDADTLVEERYLSAITNHFRQASCGAAVLPYRHQPGAGPEQQTAIEHYELFLRSYVYGLRLAGSPYAFNSVGSAMACRAQAYVRCGGMNMRKAGEDFYFLQKLAKTDGVEQLTGTTVYPEPRISERVPFGTGRSMLRMLAGDHQGVLVYPVEVFDILGEWLRLVTHNLSREAVETLQAAEQLSPVLAGQLEKLDWLRVWPRMQKTFREEERLRQAFHGWFDGFRSLRLIHLLCENGYLRGAPQELLPAYFAREGVRCPNTINAMLEKLRADDGA